MEYKKEYIHGNLLHILGLLTLHLKLVLNILIKYFCREL